MRVNTMRSLKAVTAAILSVIALALMGHFIAGVDVPPVRPATVGHGELGSIKTSLRKNTKSRDEGDLMLRSDTLKASENTEYRGTGRNIFKIETQMSRTIVGPRLVPPPPPQSSPSSPAPAPFRLSFFGFANTPGDRKRIFLSKNGDVFVGKEGDFINRRYKIVHITSNSVEIEDLINDVRQKILLNE